MTDQRRLNAICALAIYFLLTGLLLQACSAPSTSVPTVIPSAAAPTQLEAQASVTPSPLPATNTPPAIPDSTQPPPTTPPTETPTATLPVTPTAIQGDPAEALGEPDWEDTFDSSANWTLYNNDCFSSQIEDGKLIMTGETQYVCWLITLPKIQNFYLEVTTDASDCPAGAEFGLYFRGPNPQAGYAYTLTCTIKYSLVGRDTKSGEKNTLVDEAMDPELAWPTWENRLGVLANGSNYRLYANGVFLIEIEDSQFLDAGQIGLVVRGGADELPMKVYFDNLRYWELPPTANVPF